MKNSFLSHYVTSDESIGATRRHIQLCTRRVSALQKDLGSSSCPVVQKVLVDIKHDFHSPKHRHTSQRTQ